METARPITDQPSRIAGLPLDLSAVEAAFATAVARYCAERRARIDGFVEHTFGLRGALSLHRRAVGHDLWRAPANVALALPFLTTRAGAFGAQRIGWRQAAGWLGTRNIFFATEVAREVEWRVMTELLELPYAQPDRIFLRDALAEALFADPRVAAVLARLREHLARRAEDPGFRHWLKQTLASYTGSRVAAADLANALLASATGAITFHQLTPGALTLGPLLAQALSHKLAAAAFPLGSGLGGLFYSLLPAVSPAVMTAAVTTGLVGLAAVLATFSGVLTDPLQARFGLHQRRLRRLVDALEHELLIGSRRPFGVRDHYAARLLDLLDLARALQRG